MSHDSGSTTLYRLFGPDDDLLYVGIAGNPGRRFEQHAEGKPWWPLVAVIRLEHFDTREEAVSAERQAIAAEIPAHNIRDVPRRNRWLKMWPGTVKQFPDHCSRCADADRIDWPDYESWVHYPTQAQAQSETLIGFYRCRACGYTWTCFFTWRDVA